MVKVVCRTSRHSEKVHSYDDSDGATDHGRGAICGGHGDDHQRAGDHPDTRISRSLACALESIDALEQQSDYRYRCSTSIARCFRAAEFCHAARADGDRHWGVPMSARRSVLRCELLALDYVAWLLME